VSFTEFLLENSFLKSFREGFRRLLGFEGGGDLLRVFERYFVTLRPVRGFPEDDDGSRRTISGKRGFLRCTEPC